MGLDARLEVDLDEQAPPDLRGDADATWGTEGGDRIGYVATRCCAAVAHGVKSIRVICDAVHESENYASTQLSHKLEHLQNIERAISAFSARPTILGTDSSSNLAVAKRQGAASRSRHSLRRWVNLVRRAEENRIYLAKVCTDHMPADFLTKFVNKLKLQRSLRRATSSDEAVPLK